MGFRSSSASCRRPLTCAPASTTLVIGHGAERGPGLALGTEPGPAIRRAGKAARHRPRAVANGAAAARQTRHPRAALRRRAAADGGDPAVARHDAHRHRRRRDGDHRQGEAAVRLRPHRPHQRPHLEDCRRERRLAGAARHHRDQLRHLRAGPFGAVRGARPHRHRQQAGRVLPAGLDRDLSETETHRRHLDGRARGRNSRHQQPRGTCRGHRHGSPAEERRVDGRGRHDYRPRHHLRRLRRRRRPRHGAASVRDPRGVHADRRGVRNPRRRAHRQFHDWRSRAGAQPHGHHRLHGRAGRPARSLRAHPAGVKRRRRRARRQLCRAQEDADGQGRQGQPPGLPWRCDDRLEDERRRGHHHLQL